MQGNNDQASASPAPADRLAELGKRPTGASPVGSTRETIRWAADEIARLREQNDNQARMLDQLGQRNGAMLTELDRLRLEVRARDVLLDRHRGVGIEETCLCADCCAEKLAAIRDELAQR